MLLNEWWAWWTAMRGLHAQEMLNQRLLVMHADPGWQFAEGKREEQVELWAKEANGATGWVLPAEAAGVPGSGRDAAMEVRGLFSWLRSKFWGDASRTTGFQEDRGE